ncbi:MAG: hypothetical protein PSX80_10055 [bacterium]|nr:hypothetical protein [bacterium]
MKIILFTTLFAFSVSLFAADAEAQKTRRPAPKATPKPTPVSTTSTNAVVSAAKQQVSNQLHNVNVFVDKIGLIAVSLESVEKEAAARRLSGDAAAAHEKNKRNVIAAFAGLRNGLIKLESDFRTKPQLALYLPKVEGISTLAANAEDSAIAGRFVAAKDPLREVTLKLNDTLAVLPGPLAPGSVNPTKATTAPTRTVSTPGTSSSTNRPVSMTTNSGAKREPAVGMTLAEVSQSTWGAPTNKRTSTTTNGTTEVWTYTGKGTVYFFNGRVTQILR